LGHGKIENCYTPKQITGLNKKIIFVDCGGWHSAAIDEENNVYLWGWNSSNQLGLVQEINSVFVSIPTILIILNEFTNRTLKFKKLSLGSRHSVLVDLDNNLFTFGWNKYNQLFQDENEELEFEEPTKVFEFEKKVKDIKCGCWFTILTAN
jgi:alpha-tubulin suppressor-like RCC1 family protein